MNFLKRFKFPALAGILFVVALVSCEQDLTTIGAGVIGGEPFTTDKAVYDVFAFNKKIEAVQTNKLPIYQLGVFDDPIYGKTEATITSQVQLITVNPTFGIYTQDDELNDSDAIFENETIDSVVIYLPYQLDITDTDLDGVPDALEEGDDISDSTNDSDNDGVANNIEVSNGTNPLNGDTDGDGIGDADDDSNDVDIFAETVKLDSIYGDLTQNFTFKVERSTFFLRDLDPTSNFQDSQEYYSNQEFSPLFTDEVFFEGSYTVSDKEFLIVTEEDDPDTEEEDESTVSKVSPGIRVQLDAIGQEYFQTNILDQEGSSALVSSANFKEFFRGIHLSIVPTDPELLFFLDLSNAQIEVYYHYNRVVDEVTIEDQDSFNLSLLSGTSATGLNGNSVNTFINDEYPSEITDQISVTNEVSENASRIYLKGGAGAYAEIQLFEDNSDIEDIRAENWVINEANLTFYVDREALANSNLEPPRLYLYNAETNQPLYNIFTENSTEDSALGIYLNYDGILEESDDRGLKYTVNITEHLNNIIVRDSVNATLGLQVTADLRITGVNNVILPTGEEKELPASSILTPLGTVLFGSNVSDDNESNKLQLEIFYTETN